MLTLNKVNKEIKNRGYDCELMKGDAYFYFFGDSVEGAYCTSVCVSRLNALTLEQWLHELENIVQ